MRVLETITFHAGRYWPLEAALWDLAGQGRGRSRGVAPRRTLDAPSRLRVDRPTAGPPSRAESALACARRASARSSSGVDRARGSRRASRPSRPCARPSGRTWRSWSTSIRAGACRATSAPLLDAEAVDREIAGACGSWTPLARGAARRRGRVGPRAPAGPRGRAHRGRRDDADARASSTRTSTRTRSTSTSRTPSSPSGLPRARSSPQRALARGHWFTPHTWTNGIGLLANLHAHRGRRRRALPRAPLRPARLDARAPRLHARRAASLPDGDGTLAVPDRPGSASSSTRTRCRAVRGRLTMTTYDVHQHLLSPALVEALRARREPPRLVGDDARAPGGVLPLRRASRTTSASGSPSSTATETDVAVVSLAPDARGRGAPGARGRLPRGHPPTLVAAAGRPPARAGRPAHAWTASPAPVCPRGRSSPASATCPTSSPRPGRCSSSTPARPARRHPARRPGGRRSSTTRPQMQAAYLAWVAGDAARHPDLAVVFAILAGGAPVPARAAELRGRRLRRRPRPNVYLDTASYGPRALGSAWRRSAPERLVFGSDVPGARRRTRPCRPWPTSAKLCVAAVALREPGPPLRDEHPAHPARRRAAEPLADGTTALSQARGRPRARRVQVARRAARPRRVPRGRRRRRSSPRRPETTAPRRPGRPSASACDAVVYAPEDATQAKVDLIEALGAEVRLVGADLDAGEGRGAPATPTAKASPSSRTAPSPRSTRATARSRDEILDQLDEPPAAIVVPVGNGALLGGIGIRSAARAPETLRIGVAAEGGPGDGRVLAGRRTWSTSDRSATFADGLAVRVAIPLAVDVLGEVASRMLLVSEREIARAVGALRRGQASASRAPPARRSPALPQLGRRRRADRPHRHGAQHRRRRSTREPATQPESFPD